MRSPRVKTTLSRTVLTPGAAASSVRPLSSPGRKGTGGTGGGGDGSGGEGVGGGGGGASGLTFSANVRTGGATEATVMPRPVERMAVAFDAAVSAVRVLSVLLAEFRWGGEMVATTVTLPAVSWSAMSL